MYALYLGPVLNTITKAGKYAAFMIGFQLGGAVVFSQELVPELVFSHAYLQTGSGTQPAGEDGAVYIFPNVATDIDAIVTIKGRSNPKVTLSAIDLNGPVQDPQDGTGYDNAWQPQVAYNGGQAPANTNWWMEFEVSFADHDDHSKEISVNGFFVTGLDVDGDGKSLHEFLSFYNLKNYTLEQNTDIEPVSIKGTLNDFAATGKEFDGPTKNYPKINTTATDVMITNFYANTNDFVVRIGAKNGANATNSANRMSSLWFKSFAFNTPVTHSLPLSLLAFTAQLDYTNVDLNWATAMETNSSHYTIQRSFDGSNFDDKAIVMAEGNSDAEKDYAYQDNIRTISSGMIYYRLKMVDMDSRFRYSPVVAVRLGDENLMNVLVYPNPAADELRVTIPAFWQNKMVAYHMYNSSGILVREKTNANAGQTETFQIMDLPPGVYFIKTANGNQTAIQKFIKSNS
ncbi:MAG TPA: T9SS type A sorting domain-containing protein [Puia sp.]|nr:T9SS type A sorting domain-containing protein [Puia sp.]